MTWTRLLMAAAVVLLVATTSAAECAWVFWIKNETIFIRKDKPDEFNTAWEIEKAFSNRTECEQVKERVWIAKASNYDDLTKLPGIDHVNRVPGEILIISWKSGNQIIGGGHTMTFRCYPDTVDPRGK